MKMKLIKIVKNDAGKVRELLANDCEDFCNAKQSINEAEIIREFNKFTNNQWTDRLIDQKTMNKFVIDWVKGAAAEGWFLVKTKNKNR